MATKRIPDPGFAGDEGGADPGLAAALAAAAGDPGRTPEVLAALHQARVLAPVVALLGEAEETADGLRRDKSSDIAVPLLEGEDGRRALPVFTSLDSLARWDPEARPVPVEGPRAGHVAIAEQADVLVVDLAGPHTCVLETADVRALAGGRGLVPAYDDQELAAAAEPVLAAEQWLVAAWLQPGAGVDARLTVRPDPAVDAGELPGLLARLGRRLGDLDSWRARVVHGVDLALATGPPGPAGRPVFTRAVPD